MGMRGRKVYAIEIQDHDIIHIIIAATDSMDQSGQVLLCLCLTCLHGWNAGIIDGRGLKSSKME
jgi:hypothetical protein